MPEGIIIIVIAGALLVALLVTFVITWLVRRPRRRELQAVAEITSAMHTSATETLANLDRARRDGTLERHRATTVRAVQTCLDQHEQQVAARVDETIDGETFKAAVKAALPNQGWKDEYEQRMRDAGSQILDANAVVVTMDAAVTEQLERFEKTVQPASAPALMNMSADAREGWNALRHNPNRAHRFLAGDEPDLAESLEKGLLWGGGLAAGGVILQLGPDLLGKDLLITVVSNAATLPFNTVPTASIALEHLMEWVAEEVGEEIFLEAAEAIGAALTGIGAVFAAWKVVKYGWLTKRLVIDKEPLQKMRQGVREHCLGQLEPVRTQALERADGVIDTAAGRIETHARAIQQESARRHQWAVARLE